MTLQTPNDNAWKELVRTIAGMGYPEEFGKVIADSLRSEKLLRRMRSYLLYAKPRSAEEIADEMLAIRDEADRWAEKKDAAFYNMQYNSYLYHRKDDGEEQ